MIQLDEKNKLTKGNIPIKDTLLNKYDSVENIILHENQKFKPNVFVRNNIKELENVNLQDLKIRELKQLAYKIFCNYHSRRGFVNDNNIILVSRSGINESMEKIYHNRMQRDLLLEHLKVFSSLGKIIEKAILVNQAFELKKREKNNSWNYYLDGIIIDNKEYLIEFEVVSMNNGENHYRLQRLEPK